MSDETAEGAEGGEQQQQAPSWMEGLSEEHRALAEARSWDSPNKVIESYRSLEQLRGVPADRLVTLPGDEAGEDDWRQVFQRLGAPETADGYQIELPEDVGVQFDNDRLGEFKNLAAKIGLTPQQANELAKWEATSVGKALSAQQEASQADIQAQEGELQKEWGAAYERQIAAAKTAVKEFGATAEMIDALEKSSSYADVMRMFAKIGSAIGKEDSFESGSGGGADFAPMTPAQAQQSINDLMMDPEFKKQYMSGKPNAVQRIDALQAMAHAKRSA